MGSLFDAFADHLRSSIYAALDSLAPDIRRDTYIVGLWFEDDDGPPWRPTVRVVINTHTQVELMTSQGADEAEALWNVAVWCRDPCTKIAYDGHDDKGALLRDRWLKTSDLWYEDDDEVDPNAEDEVIAGVTEPYLNFLEGCIKAMHDDAFIERVFGRPLPVCIVHTDNPDAMFDRNGRANPRGLAPSGNWLGLRP